MATKIRMVRTDPVRILIPSDQQLRNINPMGTKLTIHRDLHNRIDEGFLTVTTKDTKPKQPQKESYKETETKILEQFRIKQDHIREMYPHNISNIRFTNGSLQQWQLSIDEKLFQKDTRYDCLIDKLKNKRKIANTNKEMGEIDL